jgi:hypothetical protein
VFASNPLSALELEDDIELLELLCDKLLELLSIRLLDEEFELDELLELLEHSLLLEGNKSCRSPESNQSPSYSSISPPSPQPPIASQTELLLDSLPDRLLELLSIRLLDEEFEEGLDSELLELEELGDESLELLSPQAW